MLFVILPVLVLIVVGGYYLLQLKPIRYAVVDFAIKYSMNKAVKEGRLNQESANKLRFTISGLVKTAEEANLTKEEERWFSQEVLRLVEPLEKLEKEEKLSDEDVQTIIDAIEQMRLKIIEIVNKREEK